VGLPTWYAHRRNPSPELWRAGTVPHGTTFIAGSANATIFEGAPSFSDFDEGAITIPFPVDDGQEEEGERIQDPALVTPYFVDPPIPATMIPFYTDADGDDDGSGEDDDDDGYGDDDDGKHKKKHKKADEDDTVADAFTDDSELAGGNADGATEKHIVLYPNLFLQKDNENLKIVQTTKVFVSSVQAGPSFGGICSIPMLHAEANVSQIEFTIYLETVENSDGTYWYQLQYIQEVYINFAVTNFEDGQMITWPHISVATLRKQAGEFV